MDTNITLVGCGGIGTHLALPLLNYVENYFYNVRSSWNNTIKFTLVDGDVFEDSNLGRQLITDSSIGINKARWLGGLCNLFSNKKTKINVVEEYLTEENISNILKSGWVLSCVDNNTTRKLIEEHREQLNLEVISGGNEVYDGNVYTSTDEHQSILEIHPEILNPTDINPGDSCTQASVTSPQISVTNNMIASLMLVQLFKMLSSEEDINYNKSELFCDIRSGEVAGYDRQWRD